MKTITRYSTVAPGQRFGYIKKIDWRPGLAWGFLGTRGSAPTSAVSPYKWFASGTIAYSWRKITSAAQRGLAAP